MNHAVDKRLPPALQVCPSCRIMQDITNRFAYGLVRRRVCGAGEPPAIAVYGAPHAAVGVMPQPKTRAPLRERFVKGGERKFIADLIGHRQIDYSPLKQVERDGQVKPAPRIPNTGEIGQLEAVQGGHSAIAFEQIGHHWEATRAVGGAPKPPPPAFRPALLTHRSDNALAANRTALSAQFGMHARVPHPPRPPSWAAPTAVLRVRPAGAARAFSSPQANSLWPTRVTCSSSPVTGIGSATA